MPTLHDTLMALLTSLGTLCLATLTAFLFRLAQTAGSQAVTAQAQAVGSLAADAIRYTSELAAAQAKTGTPLTGSQKLSIATAYLMRQINITPDAASDIIHATLPVVNEGADAAVKNGTVSLPAGHTTSGTEFPV